MLVDGAAGRRCRAARSERTQKGAGIAASPRVAGLQPLGRQATACLVSAACSARAGKGIRASRRSPGPVDPRIPKKRFLSGPRRPASRTRPGGPSLKPCGMPSREIHRPGSARAMPMPIHLPFGTILRHTFAFARVEPRPSFDRSIRLLHRLRAAEGSRPAVLRYPAKPPRCSRSALFSQSSVASHSRPIRMRFPEGTCTRMVRVSCWFCFGFPLPNRLLTIVMLSSIASRAKRETHLHSC